MILQNNMVTEILRRVKGIDARLAQALRHYRLSINDLGRHNQFRIDNIGLSVRIERLERLVGSLFEWLQLLFLFDVIIAAELVESQRVEELRLLHLLRAIENAARLVSHVQHVWHVRVAP